jgi:hypothetical protein
MFNRVHRFIKNITFNSGLNREKFINNKKIVNKIITKNKNMIIIRKMSTYVPPSGNNNDNNNDNNNNNNNNNDNDNDNLGYIFIMVSGVYISHSFNKNRGENL